MLSVSVATRTESLVNRSSPTCKSFVFDRALSLRLTEQLSIYASLWSWSLFITPWRGRRNLVMSQWNLPNPPLGFVIFWGTPPPPLKHTQTLHRKSVLYIPHFLLCQQRLIPPSTPPEIHVISQHPPPLPPPPGDRLVPYWLTRLK